ncbi:fatty acid desaturase family protein [Paraburkholderia lycopersici]|uniref:Fatty acid desaturase n=1 Tax=Paraburkholderia lycopersici TaxID=416944 RepID=A0A1G6GZT3_9BURK|nr:fatty acid desaturase [Paraburkholderia lycopersici]SDB87557.1 Fatty acid desaturase [Paraburkholderia lycopersici]
MESVSAEHEALSLSAMRAQGAARPPQPASAARTNAALIAFAVTALGYELVGLPLLLHAAGGPTLALLATLAPVVLATPIHWGLIHEGIHGQLARDRRVNEWLARALSIGLAMPFDAVRFGHLMHHRFTREPFDRPDVHDSPGPRWRRRVAYYARLMGGLYLVECLLPLVAFLPARLARAIIAHGVGAHGREGVQVQRLFANHAADPVRRRRARRDWLASIALYAASFALYGKAWTVLALAMYLRGLWLSVADNLPHYGVALEEPGRARDFRVPRVLGVLLMNHHLHRQHHLHPTLPWTALPALARAAQAAGAPPRTGYLAAALRQFGGLQAGVEAR